MFKRLIKFFTVLFKRLVAFFINSTNKMGIKQFCALRNFDFEKSDEKITFENFTLCQPKEDLSKEFFETPFIERIGTLGMQNFDLPFFFGRYEIPGRTLFNDIYHAEEASIEALSVLTLMLWFIKDNSVNITDLYVYIPAEPTAFTRYKKNDYSNASGNYELTYFSIKELKDALEIIKIYHDIGTTHSIERKEMDAIAPSAYNFKRYNQNNKIDRVVNFLKIARSNSFLPLKISFYMTVFESLFTTDLTELIHKIAERATLYLSGTPEVKLENFRLIKKAYDVRSKYFHGQTLNKDDLEKLTQLSIKIDDLLRKIMTKIFRSDMEKFMSKDWNEYMEKIIFQ